MVTRSPSVSAGTPSERSAPTISDVSRLAGTPDTAASPPDSAASIKARLVTDFEPGTVTRACTGRCAYGAGQGGVTGT